MNKHDDDSVRQSMTVAELMALLEGCDWRSEVRLGFHVDLTAWQASPAGLASFQVAAVVSPLPPPHPSIVWIIAAKDTTPFLVEAWAPAAYRRP